MEHVSPVLAPKRRIVPGIHEPLGDDDDRVLAEDSWLDEVQNNDFGFLTPKECYEPNSQS